MSRAAITVCADDIGQTHAIDKGCLELFELRRLSAVSVLSEAPLLSSFLQDWRAARVAGLQIGLHFNLTLNLGNQAYSNPLGHWLVSSYLGLINTREIRQAIGRQLDSFSERFGHLPDFLDGHQHVHQLPRIRDVFLEEIQKRFGDSRTFWIRNTLPPLLDWRLPDSWKCQSLAWLGGNSLSRSLEKMNIKSNHGFLGVYKFDASTVDAYRLRMRQWLRASLDGSLIMCHPANEADPYDTIGRQRPIEYLYLRSDAFQKDLDDFNVSIGFRA